MSCGGSLVSHHGVLLSTMLLCGFLTKISRTYWIEWQTISELWQHRQNTWRGRSEKFRPWTSPEREQQGGRCPKLTCTNLTLRSLLSWLTVCILGCLASPDSGPVALFTDTIWPVPFLPERSCAWVSVVTRTYTVYACAYVYAYIAMVNLSISERDLVYLLHALLHPQTYTYSMVLY